MRIAAIFGCLALLGCADNPGGNENSASAATDNFKPIATQSEFNNAVVGNRLNFGRSDYFTVRADGTLDGDFSGPLSGTWRWEDGYWCRTLLVPARPEDCQLWETNGTDFRVTREKGTGQSYVYSQ